MGQHNSKSHGHHDFGAETAPAVTALDLNSAEPEAHSTEPTSSSEQTEVVKAQKRVLGGKMDKFRRTLSFRRKKRKQPELSRTHQWQEDERKVREGSCSFQVRYLGGLEVFESRGMQICEDAIKSLKTQSKGRYKRAVLYVSGDALRVVDEISKGLIVDQTIEKVSFCAPDRHHEKGFGYICRDGTTRRWMCHAFLAVKESGERLSHAVGCAFAVCLEKKQKRERETGVSVHYSDDKTTFTRFGSFRQTTLTERREDPQSAILAEPVNLNGSTEAEETGNEVNSALPVGARQRPRASVDMLIRQGSFRQFSKLNEQQSAFKKQLSLQVKQLPSNIERLRSSYKPEPGSDVPVYEGDEEEVKEDTGGETGDSIARMCQQLTKGLSALTTDEASSVHGPGSTESSSNVAGSRPMEIRLPPPIQQTNPWLLPQQQSTHQPTRSQVDPNSNSAFTERPQAGFAYRSISMDTTRKPTLAELAKKNQSFQVSNWSGQPYSDPFDAAWASKSSTSPTTNFNNVDNSSKDSEVVQFV